MQETDNFEYADPLEKIAEAVFETARLFEISRLTFSWKNNLPPLKNIAADQNSIISTIEKYAIDIATKDLDVFFNKMYRHVLPDGLTGILTATRKKEQEAILKRISMTTDDMIALLLYSGELGYKYSFYKIELPQTGLNTSLMPRFACKNTDASLTIIGETSLSQGQIKNAINHRSVRVAKFLDKGDEWHCFFLTYKSISGEESFKEGPHIHFISHTWGRISREDVLNQLAQRNYGLSPMHVRYKSNKNSVDL